MSTNQNIKLRQLGQTDIHISPIGLGCWQFSEGKGGARGSWAPISVEETNGIVQASLDRWRVEKAFRDTKSKQHISTHPMFHWTDSKIRCHLLTCIIALTMRRLLELQVESAIDRVSAEKIIEEMRALRSLVIWYPGSKKPRQQLEEPTSLQNEVIKAFGYAVDDSWVLQSLST